MDYGATEMNAEIYFYKIFFIYNFPPVILSFAVFEWNFYLHAWNYSNENGSLLFYFLPH